MKTSCTIIVSHFESLPFLRAFIRQMKKHTHPYVKTEMLIVDQSCLGTYNLLMNEFYDEPGVKIVWTKALYSGFGLDWVLREIPINTEYIAQFHVDAFAIHDNFLYLPIKLIEEYNLSFVGQLQFISDGTQSIYPPSPIFAMAQCFNVARTETYRELSLQAGFTRFHNRPQSGLTFKNDDWSAWAEEDYNSRGSDDDIVAFSWQDRYRQDNKLGLAVTGFIAPAYGRIIEDVVFHFCSCRESIGTGGAMGEEYKELTKQINEDYSDELIEKMVNMAKQNKPPEMEVLSRNFWNGKLKQSFPTNDEINKRIEELKY